MLTLQPADSSSAIGCRGRVQPLAASRAETGKFARDWVLENKAGQPSFKATRAHLAKHPIEEVGARLRAMMPWIAKNKLVDQAKN